MIQSPKKKMKTSLLEKTNPCLRVSQNTPVDSIQYSQNKILLIDSTSDKQYTPQTDNNPITSNPTGRPMIQDEQYIHRIEEEGFISLKDQETPRINDKQKQILNDLADLEELDYNHKKDIRRELSQEFHKNPNDRPHQLEQEGQFIPVLLPQQIIRVIWDLFTMIFIIHEIIAVPLDLSFSLSGPYLDNMNFVTTSIFMLDIIINFNTAYQYKGIYETGRKKIAGNYFKFWFWIDFLSSCPFDIIIDAITVTQQQNQNQTNQGGNSAIAIGMRILRVLKFFRFIKVMKLLRVLKLKKIFGKFEDYLDLSSAMITIYELLKLIFMMLFCAHWLACIWHMIADYEEQAGISSWLTDQGLVDKAWDIKYVASVYWATATMTTVGYGDIVPYTSTEKIFGIVVMLLACCIFAYIMNSIGGIFVTMDQNEKLVRQKMAQANEFLQSNDIPKDLQARVKKYLEYKYEWESSQVNQKEALLVLSSSLRDEVLAAVNFNLINSTLLLKNRFSSTVLGQLPFLLEEQIFGPEECIFNLGDDGSGLIDDRSIYFLNKGQVLLCVPQTVTQLKVLEQGQTFGELGFFSNKPRTASAYTLDFVYVQKLKKVDFQNLLKLYEEDQQKFTQDKHIIEVTGTLQPLNLRCFACTSISHFAINCPNLHYSPNYQQKLELIKQFNIEQSNFMKSFKRHEKVRYNSRSYISLTQEVAKEINYVYKKVQHMEDEADPSNLSISSQESQDKPNFTMQLVQLEVDNDHFDRVKYFKYYFQDGNLESIVEQYNKLIYSKQKTVISQERRLMIQNGRPATQFKKVKWPRSSSAERSVYFEKLVESQGGSEEFLNRVNSHNQELDLY